MCLMRYNAAMRLADYLKRNRLSCAEFAARLGIHRTEVWNYKTGRRQPRADKVALIEEVTRGKVRAKDFYRTAA